MTSTEDAQGASDIVGDRLRQLRKQRGLSVEEAAARCEKLGAPELTANALYSIEGGRRKDGERTRRVTVDELLALAYALDVSPLALLLPSDASRYAVTRGHVTSLLSVYEWIHGRCKAPDDQCSADPQREGVPAGLPEKLADWEALRRTERSRSERALRSRNTDLEQVIEDLSSPNSPVLAAVSRLHEDAMQAAENARQTARQAAEEAAARRFAVLEKSVLGPLQELATKSPEGTYARELSAAILEWYQRGLSESENDQSRGES